MRSIKSVKININGYASAGMGDLFEWEPLVRTRKIRPLKQDPQGLRTGGIIVHGDSMIGDRIHDGDIVIYLKTGLAVPGSIVVVRTPWGNYVKRFSPKSDGTVELISSNPSYRSQFWATEDIQILGVVKRVERDY